MNKLSKHIFVVLLLSVISFTTYAQGRRDKDHRQDGYYRPQPGNRNDNRGYNPPNPEAMKRVQEIKERFISRQLSLTPEQSEKFWPLYRQYQGELNQIRQSKRANLANPNGSEQIKKDMEYDSQLINTRRRYNNEFLKILPPDKVSELYKSERGFTDELIKNLHERNNNSSPE